MKLPSNKYVVEDEDGNVLIEAPLLDLYYLIAFNSETAGFSQIENMQRAASVVNQAYGTNLSWGQTMEILIDLQTQVDEVKKKATSSQG